MLWRKRKNAAEDTHVKLRGYDDIPVSLGDLMRGERATLGKSILDVERDLRIKARYLLAIENADLSAFDSKGFVAGYIRAYARFLGMEPETAVQRFCEETGFEQRPGSGAKISQGTPQTSLGPDTKLSNNRPLIAAPSGDFISRARTPFLPADEGPRFSITPQAIGSLAVLFAVIGGLTYGGFALLHEVQKVNLVASDAQPTALAELDPIASVVFAQNPLESQATSVSPRDGMTRRYRAEPLDRPRLVPRDGPIASLDPTQYGVYATRTQDFHPEALPQVALTIDAMTDSLPQSETISAQVNSPAPATEISDTASMNLALAPMTNAPRLSFGASVQADQLTALDAQDSIPSRPKRRPSEAPNVQLVSTQTAQKPINLATGSTPAAPAQPAVTVTQLPQPENVFRGLTAVAQPSAVQLFADTQSPRYSVFTLRPAWVRVTASDGSVIFEKTLRPGEEYVVPAMADAPSLRAGMAGMVYFRIGDQVYGPAGSGERVLAQQTLSRNAVLQNFAPAQPEFNAELADVLVMLQVQDQQ